MITTLGLRAAARAIGVSHVALLKAETDGRVPKRVNGLFDVEACRAAMAANSHPTKARAGRSQQQHKPVIVPAAVEPDEEGPPAQSIAEAARQLEWEKVRAIRQKTDREEGRLVELIAVNAFVAGMIMKARDELIRIGAEIADVVACESDPVKCRATIDDRIGQALENLKEYRPA
jgi:hypothetical protein